MAPAFLFTLCAMMVLPRAESCFIPQELYALVPQLVLPGYEITKVDVSECDSSVRITVSDPHFTVRSSGVIVASQPLYVGGKGRTFSVRAQDDKGPGSKMEVHLVHSEQTQNKGPGFLKRSKRRWSPPPFNLLENDPGPYPKDIEKVVSDSEVAQPVYYTMSGPGYNQHPVGVFSLDRDSGMLTVHKTIDREEFPMFRLTVRVFSIKTNAETDLPLPIEIHVDDENDNTPDFASDLKFTVPEHSKAGTEVGKVNATDRDQKGTLHVKIRYTLKTGLDMFAINPGTGVITTKINTLDREVQDKYLVTVEIKDMDGAVNGLFRTGTATITVGDINDNPPTFTAASYKASVRENESEKSPILKIPVEDKDLVNTPNWISKFVITKGNENGNFRVDTDPKTNEGLLYVVKPLNYEKSKVVKLEVEAQNQVELSSTDLKWNSIPVEVAVTDVDEGPEFSAPTIHFNVKENTPNGTLIGTYTATDPENKSTGIKYYKVSDPASWINVDKNTGQLKVANTIDRESSHVSQDGTYNITMKAVDSSSKTGSGTVVIHVEDVNDNVPKVPAGELVMCEKAGELGSVLVVAEDKDAPPFSSPFTFSLPADSDDTWTVTRLNGTTATLKHNKELPTGMYSVPVVITDLQGFGETQKVPVRICECRNGICLAKDRSASFGGMGVLAMLLPLLLLLLLCLLLGFLCVTQREKLEVENSDSGGIILKSNTEGRGDEVDVSLIPFPNSSGGEITKGSVKESLLNAGIKSTSTLGAQSGNENWMYKSGGDFQDFGISQYDVKQYGASSGGQLVGAGMNFDNRQVFQQSSFLHNWETNGIYLHQKLGFLGTEEDGRYADDITHSYEFEGVGSAAGSVGCCSDFGDGDNLEFLNALGPKFKTLADVCKKT